MEFRGQIRRALSGQRAAAASACAMLVCLHAPAQQLIGYVNTRDAEVSGASDVLNGQAVLTGSASVTAREHTAAITLGRGGSVRVCQTSALKVTESKSAELAAPLLFSLDRGAIEIETDGTVNDSIMTPDLRFTIVNRGPLDLRLRIARNGDTCVENRGPSAPTLDISDPFGETMYQVGAGQHVLFEHGSLHEVVDHESTPCGCPASNGMSLADALLASGGPKPPPPAPVASPAAVAPAATVAPPGELQAEEQAAAKTATSTADRAAAAHPFPEAVSEGLAPPPEVPAAPAGQVHMQITDTLSYSAQQPGGERNTALAEKQKPVAIPQPQPQQAAAPKPGLFHAVGRFFKSLFAD